MRFECRREEDGAMKVRNGIVVTASQVEIAVSGVIDVIGEGEFSSMETKLRSGIWICLQFNLGAVATGRYRMEDEFCSLKLVVILYRCFGVEFQVNWWMFKDLIWVWREMLLQVKEGSVNEDCNWFCRTMVEDVVAWTVFRYGSLVCSLKFRNNGTYSWVIALQLGSELFPSIHGDMELGTVVSYPKKLHSVESLVMAGLKGVVELQRQERRKKMSVEC